MSWLAAVLASAAEPEHWLPEAEFGSYAKTTRGPSPSAVDSDSERRPGVWIHSPSWILTCSPSQIHASIGPTRTVSSRNQCRAESESNLTGSGWP